MLNDFPIGIIVKSNAGRDFGEYFVVVGYNSESVLVANGKTRKIENPKKKNVKHLIKFDNLIIKEVQTKLDIGEKLGNKRLKKLLAEKLKQEE